MKAISRLKTEAREHEQQEDWRQALASYERVVEVSDEHGLDVELSVYNRIGDLHLRLGQQRKAVKHYEHAADRYAEAGLLNNAIALCNKVLRHVPEHTQIFLKLGRLSAGQGFITDARRWFLDYAEAMAKLGDLDSAFAALDEFAGLAGDADVRATLAQQLVVHDREDEAVRQLQHAYQLRTDAGEVEEAESVASQIRELAPDAPLEPPRTDPADLPGLHQVELDSAADAAGIEGDEEEGDAPAAPDAYDEIELEPGPEETAEAEPEEDSVEPLPLLGEDSPASADQAAPVEAAAEASGDAEVVEAGAAGAEAVEAESAEAEPIEAGPRGSPEAETDAEDAEPLPLLGDDDDDEVVDAGAADAEAVDAVGAVAEDADDGVAADVREEIQRARSLAADDRVDEAVALLAERHASLAESGDLAAALAVVGALVDVDGDRIEAHHRRVEYARELGDDDRLVAAHLDLAAALERAGDKQDADAAYREVLELEPANVAARAALEVQSEPPPAEDDDGYVDLGALLREDEEDEATTRFVVEEATPTGDEERDFADMLSQFKTKIAEHMDDADGASHYDLGLAFKEMGLVDEAIKEFQTALRGGQARLQVYEELGECFMLKEQYTVAIRVLRRAERLAEHDDEDLLAVCYHLGRCYEETGDVENARAAYERVVGVDIGFRDAAERIAGL